MVSAAFKGRREITAKSKIRFMIRIVIRSIMSASVFSGSRSEFRLTRSRFFDSLAPNYRNLNMPQNCFHPSIEGAQHGAKNLPDFLDYAKRSGATGAQPSNYMVQAGKRFQ